MGDAAGYFVRKATGLVRAWSAFDAFVYAFFSVNFVSSLILVSFVSYYVAIGMEGYARIQKFCFWGGIVALGVVLLLLLIGTQGQFQQAFNREAARLFGASGDAYAQTIEASRKN